MLDNHNIISLAREVFDTEIQSMITMRDALDETFVEVVKCVHECKGKVIFTGMGKPGHICKKLAATLSSLGTPSFYLHPAEAQHGDLGMVSADDLVIAISYSGESDEVIRLIPNIRLIGAKLIGMTAKANSTLGQNCDILQLIPPITEACYMHLAPTSSTTVELAYGDALAVVTARLQGFAPENFAAFHPAGALGKKLILKVADLMNAGKDNAVVKATATIREAIVEMSTKQLGMVTIVNDNNMICGVITDGDLRRALEKQVDIYNLKIADIMTATPKYIGEGAMAIEALQVMKKSKISAMPILNEDGKVVGTITLAALIGAGLIV